MTCKKKNGLGLWLVFVNVAISLGGCASVANNHQTYPVQINKDTTETVSTMTKPQPVGQSDQWELVFQDEFNASELDRSIWADCYWWDWEDNGCTNESNNELEWYTPENVLVENGVLKLRAQQQVTQNSSGRNFMYTAGMVTSGPVDIDYAESPGFAFQYGYIEVRARVPQGAGLWPAIWLLPANLDSQLEIDIVEILGHDPQTAQMHYHYTDESGEYVGIGDSWTGPDFSQDWHVFALDWKPDYAAWYIDGVKRWQAESPHLPDEPMYLIMNIAVGGDWPGSPTTDTPFPTTFDIDYVRVWKRSDRD